MSIAIKIDNRISDTKCRWIQNDFQSAIKSPWTKFWSSQRILNWTQNLGKLSEKWETAFDVLSRYAQCSTLKENVVL